MKNRPLSPDDVSRWISEDISRGKGLVNESLYGFTVIPGREPVDRLISYIDDVYIDFKPSDPKFQKIVRGHLKQQPQTAQDWFRLIDSSSQNDRLKNKLKEVVADDLAQAEDLGEPDDVGQPEDPPYIVETARGAKIPVYEIAVGKPNNLLYLAMSPPGKYKGWVRGNYNGGGHWRNRPKSWIFGKISGSNGRLYWTKYNSLITIKISNIVAVYKDGHRVNLSSVVTR